MLGENTKKDYWLSESLEDIVADVADHVRRARLKLTRLLIQDPESLPVIAPDYHEFNRFRMLPDDLLEEKLTNARLFLEVARARVPRLIPGCMVESAETRLDDFIRDATTHQLNPPQAADPATQQWIAANFRVGVIRSLQNNHPIPCPVCWHDHFLRGWQVPDHTMALCYNCGAVSFCDNGQVLQEFVGNRWEWGARAIAMAAAFQDRVKNSERKTKA